MMCTDLRINLVAIGTAKLCETLFRNNALRTRLSDSEEERAGLEFRCHGIHPGHKKHRKKEIALYLETWYHLVHAR
jgi:hypothetical protein